MWTAAAEDPALAFDRIHFTASPVAIAQDSLRRLVAHYGQAALDAAEVVVALGGDGLMLSTLQATRDRGLPIYGMNRGTVGFLMNAYGEHSLKARLENAEETVIHPLRMIATRHDGSEAEALAINEVSLLRAGPQAASSASSSTGASGWPNSSATASSSPRPPAPPPTTIPPMARSCRSARMCSP